MTESSHLPFAIEVIRRCEGRRPRVALLDFDGTLSLVRGGWRPLMVDLMVEALLPHAGAESPAALAALAARHVDRLTGRATIEQMAWLAGEIEQRGGVALAPELYKRRYAARLDELVAGRLARLRQGALPPDGLLVPGARALLQDLQERGLLLVLASGTDEAAVRSEAAAIGLDHFFGQHIYAPGPNQPGFSKRAVVERILRDERIAGPELLVIGDGPVEIAEARAVGAVAVGIACDEERGGLDQRKRADLIAAGADLIVPDFEDHRRLVEYVFGGRD